MSIYLRIPLNFSRSLFPCSSSRLPFLNSTNAKRSCLLFGIPVWPENRTISTRCVPRFSPSFTSSLGTDFESQARASLFHSHRVENVVSNVTLSWLSLSSILLPNPLQITAGMKYSGAVVRIFAGYRGIMVQRLGASIAKSPHQSVNFKHIAHPSSASRGNTSFENIVRLATVSSWSRRPPCPIISRCPKPPTWP